MSRRIIAVIGAIAVTAVLIIVGAQYSKFVSETIYQESTAHLTEIYHQTNRSLHNLVAKNWSNLRMWAPYFRDIADDNLVEKYIENAKEEIGFTDFYFITGDGSYLTESGKTGYLDLRESLPSLILRGENVVESAVVPGQPEIMVFAVPAEAGSYRGFEYEAIAISYNNSDLVDALKISAFNGQSASCVIRSDGRVLVNNPGGSFRNVYNLLGMLETNSDMTEEEIDALQNEFTNGRSGVMTFGMEGREYYLVYESADFEDWTVLGIVPADVVNASMNALRTSTMLVMAGAAAALIVLTAMILIGRYRRSLSKKDTEILYSEELFSTLSRNVDDIFAMLDGKTLHVDYISPNVEKLVGIPERTIRADIHVVNNLVKTPETGLILDKLPEIPAGEQAEWDREYIHQVTGETGWFHATALCRRFRGEKKYILMLSDRTRDKRINQELEDAVSMARKANQAKSTFLSNMSHDIRTPMNAIIGFTTLAVANVENTEKVKDYLTKILSSGNHLLSLLSDILDMCRIESGKIRPEETAVNLSEMLHEIKNIIIGQVNAKELELYMDAADVTDENVYCDKTRINQVLLNLLSNAIKFTPAGGMISVRAAQTEKSSEGKGMYELRVRDTGIGMSSEFAERIFEPFERERTSTVSRIQGTGLGMAISKNLIDMMGGSIEVQTEKGKGTEFVIRLCLRLQSEGSEAKEMKELEGMRVLVADSDPSTDSSMAKMLVRAGMRPEETANGSEALMLAKQSVEQNDPFRVYIIDERLPDTDIMKLIKELRNTAGSTAIIILTGYDLTDMEEQAKAAGANGFCTKPVFMSDLQEALQEALGHNRSKEEQLLPYTEEAALFKGKRILLAEDNELNMEIASEILKEYGFQVEPAENGMEALKKVSASEPGYYDLVLMDISMPIMDGYEATRRIRVLEDPRLAAVPIVAMTANAFDEDRRAAAECGMNGFISKPVNMEAVVRALRNVLDS